MKSNRPKKHKRGGRYFEDPLEDVEKEEGVEFSGKMHEMADKPKKPPKKTRSEPAEGYFPLHK